MRNILIVVDMQNDFVTGALGTAEARAVVSAVVRKAQGFSGEIYFTRDTHEADYLGTQEGKNLPVEHCIKGTAGWQIVEELQPIAERCKIFDKPAFGSTELMDFLYATHQQESIDTITLVGLCTDICVISNAMLLKASLPETVIKVDAACCAGVTQESHDTALRAMRACQIVIE